MERIKIKINNFISMWKCENYLDSIRIFQFVLILLGFPAFLFHENKFLNHKNSFIRFFNKYFMLIFWISFYSYLFYANIIDNNFVTLSSSQVANTGRRFAILVGTAYMILGVPTIHYVYQASDQIIQGIMHFDTNIQKLNTAVNHQFEFKYITMFVIFNVIESISFIYFAATYLDSCDTLRLCVLMHLPIYVIAAVHVQFVSYILIFGTSIIYRFKLLNQHLWRYCKINEEFRIELKFDYKDNRTNPIMMFADLHDKLNDSVDQINRCYAIQLMLGTAAIFGFLVVTLFAVFRTFFYEDVKLGVLTGSLVLWCIYYSFTQVNVIIVGSKITSHAKNTAVVVHRLINTSSDAKLRYELEIFSQQLIHRVPQISCGLFPFDWTLMYSIVSAITTYLVILIQFDASFDGPSDNSTKKI